MFTLDVSAAEKRLLWSYWGAARKAHNWVIGEVKANLAARKAERKVGVAEEGMTPALWLSAQSLSKRWNEGYDRKPQTPPRDQVRHRTRKPTGQGHLREEPSTGRPGGAAA